MRAASCLPGPSALLAAVWLRARRGQRTESGTLTTLALDPQQRHGSPVPRHALETVRTARTLPGPRTHLSVRDLVEAVTGGPNRGSRGMPSGQLAGSGTTAGL